MSKYILGIDVGGTNLKFGVMTESGEIVHQNAFKTADFEAPQLFVDSLFDYLSNLNYLADIKGVGICAPNGNCFNGSIDYAPNLIWKGVIPLCELFEAKFKVKAVLSNDANAAAIGEKLFGAGRKYAHFVMITLGTGLGSGVIVSDKLVLGANGYAGEFGHIRVVNDGRLCNCGRKGCLETYASATGVVRSYHEQKEKNTHSSLWQYDAEMTSKIIFEEAHKGDELANEIVDFTAKVLGNALADYACFSDPQAYILFGGMTHSGGDFVTRVQKYMDENLLAIFKDKIKVEHSEIQGCDAALLGAVATYLVS